MKALKIAECQYKRTKRYSQYMGSIFFLLLLMSLHVQASEKPIWQSKAATALPVMLQNIQDNYAYAAHKNINWSCLKDQYTAKIPAIESRNDVVLFFEFLLIEFADSHMTLNTNIQDSFRLNAPIKVKQVSNRFILDDFWQSQIIDAKGLTIGAELLSINGNKPSEIIKDFPVLCLDKSQADNQQWIINKALAGQYSKPRIIELAVADKVEKIDLDQLKYHPHNQPLEIQINEQIAVISINNSLGQTALINAFDQAIEASANTKGLILDLRNTISGGDSYIARAIISRLISQDRAYQKHRFEEHRESGPQVPRIWTEFVSPRLTTYQQPMAVLVNAWTGSMGEGLTIGLHGMKRAHVFGSPMAGLLGAVYGYSLEGIGFGYQMPAEQLFHVDGSPRENFIPDEIVKPDTKNIDAVLGRAIEWFKIK